MGDVRDTTAQDPVRTPPVVAIGTCSHEPCCPAADTPGREAAHTISAHPEQGWSLLCNGVVLFEDTGELLPDGGMIAPHRPTDTNPGAFGLIAV